MKCRSVVKKRMLGTALNGQLAHLKNAIVRIVEVQGKDYIIKNANITYSDLENILEGKKGIDICVYIKILNVFGAILSVNFFNYDLEWEWRNKVEIPYEKQVASTNVDKIKKKCEFCKNIIWQTPGAACAKCEELGRLKSIFKRGYLVEHADKTGIIKMLEPYKSKN